MNSGGGERSLRLVVAGIGLSIQQHNDDGVTVNLNTGSRLFFNSPIVPIAGYQTEVLRMPKGHFPHGEVVFSGMPWGTFQMPYRWRIIKMDQSIAVCVDYDGHQGLDAAMAVVNPVDQTIIYYLDAVGGPLSFDLYENPLGILLTIYLAHFNGGIVIHASGVDDGGRGYLFTGVSGIGKSTMAGVWQKEGAAVVNDDRLVVMPVNGDFTIANTPMPSYTDRPKEAPLRAMFLLSQKTENSCCRINGAKALSLLMANCMQHFHSKKMVEAHLEILGRLVQKVPVFELGFKPDSDVVALIRQMDL